MNNDQKKVKIISAYNDLNINTINALDDFYSENIFFQDPLSEVRGLMNLKKYYQKMYKSVEEIKFDFHSFVFEDENVFATWTMSYRTKSLNGRDYIKVEGASLLKFGADQRISYHRDYFDMGALIYEHVPVLGFLIRKFKSLL